MSLNTEYKPPADYKPPVVKVSDKVMIPQEEHPDINFVGLLIGPRGNTLKKLEKETGAKIIIRGKGSVKEGKIGRKDGQPLPGEDEPLHAYVTAGNPENVKKAVDKIKEIIRQGIEVPEGQNDLRREQLRELALLNGTLRENDGLMKLKQLQQAQTIYTNTVLCTICGGAGHLAQDCKQKRPGDTIRAALNTGPLPTNVDKAKMDSEYMSLMAELGEGPPPPKQDQPHQAHHQPPPPPRPQFNPSSRIFTSHQNQPPPPLMNQAVAPPWQPSPSQAPPQSQASQLQQQNKIPGLMNINTQPPPSTLGATISLPPPGMPTSSAPPPPWQQAATSSAVVLQAHTSTAFTSATRETMIKSPHRAWDKSLTDILHITAQVGVPPPSILTAPPPPPPTSSQPNSVLPWQQPQQMAASVPSSIAVPPPPVTTSMSSMPPPPWQHQQQFSQPPPPPGGSIPPWQHSIPAPVQPPAPVAPPPPPPPASQPSFNPGAPPPPPPDMTSYAGGMPSLLGPPPPPPPN